MLSSNSEGLPVSETSTFPCRGNPPLDQTNEKTLPGCLHKKRLEDAPGFDKKNDSGPRMILIRYSFMSFTRFPNLIKNTIAQKQRIAKMSITFVGPIVVRRMALFI